MRALLLLLLLSSSALLAQGKAQRKEHFNFVAPNISGRVILPPTGPGWKAETVALYDKGTRPAIQMTNIDTKVELSVVLFANDTGKPTSVACRDAVIDNVLSSTREHATVEDEKRDTRTVDGVTIATASYLLAKAGEVSLRQKNVFAFIGTATACAELHLSEVRYVPEYAKGLDDLVNQFRFDAAYQPTSEDYSTMGSLMYSAAQDYGAATVYFQRALDTISPAAPSDYRRFVNDQLGMSLGISGDIGRSRSVFQAAIKTDPKYPMYYYNLAAGYAEQGDTVQAKHYLQQAFDRRADVLRGEAFPDPAKDDSFLKLKSDAAFWSFVTGLSQQLEK